MMFAILSVSMSANAQEATNTPRPLAPNFHWLSFPADLYCDEIKGVSKGPTWGDITIGVSKVQDLKRYVSTIYDSEVYEYADFIQLNKKGKFGKKDGIPDSVHACIDFDTQTVTALLVAINWPLYIQDLVAQYGLPDAVTWSASDTSRIAFWFEKGFAASISIRKDYKILAYGEITTIYYFPYQSKYGFEARWPYNQTNEDNPSGGDEAYIPTPSQEQNPFDFQAMIATITAEPSRTPTPTFVPYTPVATSTP
ncbi:MAG: hypothetical protein H0X30_29185 [Anaerolineae bacterium]|nr:hypothetical protein [Anaerolineae bacterium]